jgi:DNA (cytosine-5)-methyltransferase 1
MRLVVEQACPNWVVVEQPAGNAEWEAEVKGDLAGLGFYSTRLKRSARDCGAPHERRRVFIVANPVRERCEKVAWLTDPSAVDASAWPAPPRGAWRQAGAGNRRMDDGFSDWVDRLRALGNSVIPAWTEIIGRAIMTTQMGR